MDGQRFDRATRRLGQTRTRRGVLRALAGLVGVAAAREAGEVEAQVCTMDGGLCPFSCSWGSSCSGCCGGRCGSGGVCASGYAGCTGSGCSCTVGLSFQCGYGLTCCSLTGAPYSGGTCQWFCPYR